LLNNGQASYQPDVAGRDIPHVMLMAVMTNDMINGDMINAYMQAAE
jgi:hypothetical protein